MKKLAKIYRLEVRDEPGSVIVEDDGTERPISKEDVATLLDISHFEPSYKLCPLMTYWNKDGLPCYVYCKGEECAWWDGNKCGVIR